MLSTFSDCSNFIWIKLHELFLAGLHHQTEVSGIQYINPKVFSLEGPDLKPLKANRILYITFGHPSL